MCCTIEVLKVIVRLYCVWADHYWLNRTLNNSVMGQSGSLEFLLLCSNS